MRVLFYNHTSTVSGAERVLLLISTGLREEEFSPTLMCPEGDLAETAKGLGISYLPVPDLRARFTLRPDLLFGYLTSMVSVVLQIRRALRESRPDLIHANSTRAGISMSLASLGLKIPVIWHIHDILPPHPITSLIRLLVRLSPGVRLFAVSQATANALRGVLLRSKPIAVILNCVDLDRFKPDPEVRMKYRQELGLNESDIAVAIVGQITKRKGQLGLIRAFSEIASTTRDLHLLVVGKPLFVQEDQDYFAKLQEEASQIKRAGDVHFLGGRSDVASLMQAADILVVNSLAEPCGLVVLEGMASGLPVIATNVGGNPEMVVDRQSGCLTPADDPTSLAALIEKLASSPEMRLEMGKNARARVASEFTVPTYLEAVSTLYRSCLGLEDDRREVSPKSMSRATS